MSDKDFDAMLLKFRDERKILLHTSSTDSFTKDDIRDSLTDDRGLERTTEGLINILLNGKAAHRKVQQKMQLEIHLLRSMCILEFMKI